MKVGPLNVSTPTAERLKKLSGLLQRLGDTETQLDGRAFLALYRELVDFSVDTTQYAAMADDQLAHLSKAVHELHQQNAHLSAELVALRGKSRKTVH